MAADRVLKLLLRAFGGMSVLALPFVFLPTKKMNVIHEQVLGMGALPNAPIVGYLARSTSMFYAMLGGLLILLSFDLRRYRPALRYLLGTSVVFGALITCIDILERMPPMWAAIEGPLIVVLSVLMLVLLRKVPNQAPE